MPAAEPVGESAQANENSANSVGEHVPTAGGSSKIHKIPADHIVFLCPNGHKLNGPTKLAGRLGQCPHCHEKFEIPPLDVIRAAEAARAEAGEYDGNLSDLQSVEFDSSMQSGVGGSRLGQAAVAEPEGDTDQFARAIEAVRSEEHQRRLEEAQRKQDEQRKHEEQQRWLQEKATSSSAMQRAVPAAPTAQALPTPTRAANHPLADLVVRLWDEREHGGIIELHLAGGNVYLPDWFEKHLSMQTHGLFAAQAADGTVTMTVIPWDEVERVVIRGVVGLPDGMFD
ncbi:MAG: hypothetical protein QM811_05465 [Pirellulales bacterium]